MSKEPFSLRLAPILYKSYFNLILRTCRIRFLNREGMDSLEERGLTWILSIWHENAAMGLALGRGRSFAMMASDSRDGEYISRCIEAYGNIPVRGSSSRGGMKAAKAMVRWLRAGHVAVVTPDGPRGPRRKLQSGILWMGALSGVPLIPVHQVATRQWELHKTWDKHHIPKPFSTVFVTLGAPYYVDKTRLKTDESAVVAEFEALMNTNAELAESLAASA